MALICAVVLDRPGSGFAELAAVGSILADDYRPSEKWRGSPFEWLQTLPAVRRGAAGRRLVERWARGEGFTAVTVTTPDKQLFIIIDDIRVQLKMSTLWQGGTYRFQQIRDKDYDFCLFLGISPTTVHAWLVPKDVLDVHVINHLGQHTGVAATETSWVTVNPSSVPRWMSPFGDGLSRVAELLRGA